MSRWYAMSTHFLTDEKVEVLGEKHGPAGPLVVVALLCRAKTQAQGGKVDGTYRDLSHLSFSDREEIKDILTTALKVGMVEGELNGTGYRLSFPKWEKWQAAFRKAQSRSRKKAEASRGVTDSHESSRKVTNRTEQDKTEQTPKRLTIEKVYHEWVRATGKTGTILTQERKRKIVKALQDYPLEDVVDAVRGIAESPWHRGENPEGRKWLDLTLALRDGAHIERFRDEHRGANKTKAPSSLDYDPLIDG